jgi:hypothetical protein
MRSLRSPNTRVHLGGHLLIDGETKMETKAFPPMKDRKPPLG